MAPHPRPSRVVSGTFIQARARASSAWGKGWSLLSIEQRAAHVALAAINLLAAQDAEGVSDTRVRDLLDTFHGDLHYWIEREAGK